MRLLVVEDEQIVLELMKRQGLDGLGIPYDTTGNGDEAWEMFQRGQYGIVSTDDAHYGIAGWELLRRVKERDPSVKTIMFTGGGEIPDDVRAYADRIFLKPTDMSKYAAALRELAGLED